MTNNRSAPGAIVLVQHEGKIIAGQHVRSFDLREHKVFHAMWSRCTNPNHVGFERYGARGIAVCDRWKSFPAFYLDMGPRPTPKHTIERRDNDKGYEPGNCYWATRRQQNVNKRNTVFITVNGKRTALWEYAELVGVPIGVLRSRLRTGWTLDDAVAKPVHPCKRGADRKPSKKYERRAAVV